MRNILRLLSVFVAIAALSACPEPPEKVTGRDIIYLSANDMQSFITILPAVLDFSRSYQESLSQSEKDSPDYNENYFQALLKQDDLIQKVQSSGFESKYHFLDVYISVFMALELQPENTEDFEKNMNEFRISIKRQMEEISELEKSSLDDFEQKILQGKKKTLENQKRLFANIYFVQDYHTRIQAAMQGSQ